MGPLALCDFCQLAPYIEILLLTVTYLLTYLLYLSNPLHPRGINLRYRSHSVQLPSHTMCLSDSNFITRMLYKDKY